MTATQHTATSYLDQRIEEALRKQQQAEAEQERAQAEERALRRLEVIHAFSARMDELLVDEELRAALELRYDAKEIHEYEMPRPYAVITVDDVALRIAPDGGYYRLIDDRGRNFSESVIGDWLAQDFITGLLTAIAEFRKRQAVKAAKVETVAANTATPAPVTPRIIRENRRGRLIELALDDDHAKVADIRGGGAVVLLEMTVSDEDDGERKGARFTLSSQQMALLMSAYTAWQTRGQDAADAADVDAFDELPF